MRARTLARLAAFASLVTGVASASAQSHPSVDCINARLCGTLLDFTRNGRCDRRVCSPALCQCRDLYVYLPPGYDSKGSYPLLIWLHSYTNDEREFANDVVQVIDRAIACGQLPPVVVAAPDGSLTGNSHFVPLGSWYVNSQRGRFADYICGDVVQFMEQNFAVCHDRTGRAIAGFSMGGFGAYSIGLKHRDKFKVVAGISPPLNMRYVGENSDYFASFSPTTWTMRADFRGSEVIGRFYGGLVKIRAWQVVWPIWGKGPEAIERASQDNPIELLDRLGVQNGEQDYYVGYGKSDELNIDAQVESFLQVAGRRGIEVETHSYPCGHHSIAFMISAMPDLLAWLKTHLSCPAASTN